RSKNELCHMFGLWRHKKATESTYYGLHSMHHRGQDGPGIVRDNGEELKVHKDVGVGRNVVKSDDLVDHTGSSSSEDRRDATQDTGVINNDHPLAFHSLGRSTAIAHNGNVMNADKLRRDLEQEGSVLQSSSDTEVLAHLIRKNGHWPMEEAIVAGLNQLVG